MSLMSVLFAPNGRINPSQFQTGALVLLGIGFVLALVPLTGNGALIGVQTLVGLAMIYPWVVLWRKRLHDSGKSGWFLLLIVLVWFIISMIASQIITMMFAGDMMQAMEDVTGFSQMMQAQAQLAEALALPNAISSLVVGLIVVFGANAILKSDPEENRYGPPVGGEGEAAQMDAPTVAPAPAATEAPAETPTEDPDQKT
ncbi:DUF805 domain-containing protein [Oceanicaulis alexandrii]|uniref:DUF805 domain-containing protein n=1 Tax=Oceanicaulis alexandrii TaxID=153233 RepID=UPI00235506D5|nr:DUF805 domain-containing protein [Oceanicaulis alexandrii]